MTHIAPKINIYTGLLHRDELHSRRVHPLSTFRRSVWTESEGSNIEPWWMLCYNTSILLYYGCLIVNADGWYVTCSREEKKSWLWLRKLISTPQSLVCQAISGDPLLNCTVPNCIWYHVTEFRVIAHCSSQQGLLQAGLVTSVVAAILDVKRSREFVIVQSG